jgi:hypothetical protein
MACGLSQTGGRRQAADKGCGLPQPDIRQQNSDEKAAASRSQMSS